MPTNRKKKYSLAEENKERKNKMEPKKGETAEFKEDKSAAGKSGKGQGSVQGSKITKSTSTSATTNKPKTLPFAQTYTVPKQGRTTSPGGAKRVQQKNIATNDSQTTGDQYGTDAIKEGNDGSVISKKADEDKRNVQEKPRDACNELQQSDEQHTRPEPPQDRSTDHDEKDSILKKRKEECDEYKIRIDELEEANKQLEIQQKEIESLSTDAKAKNAKQKTKIENLEKESADAKEKNKEHEKTIKGQFEKIQKVENERNYALENADAKPKADQKSKTTTGGVQERKGSGDKDKVTGTYAKPEEAQNTTTTSTATAKAEDAERTLKQREKEIGEHLEDGTEAEEADRKLKQREEECRATGNDFYQSVKQNRDQKMRNESLKQELADAKSKMQQLEITIEERTKTIELLTTENAKIIKCEGDKLQSQASEYSNLKEKMQELEKRIEERDKTIELLTHMNVEIKMELRNLNAGLQEQLEQAIDERDQIVQLLHEDIAKLGKQAVARENKLRDQVRQLKSYEEYSRERENEMQKMRSEYRDLKERFGKVAGAKRVNENPDLINLGDKRRMTKVAEEYNAIYNDTWTDASAMLQDTARLSDEEATKNLLNILKDCLQFCQQEADGQFYILQEVLINPIESVLLNPNPMPQGNLSPHTVTALREVRKDISIEATHQVKSAYMKHVDRNGAYGKDFVDKTRPYLEKCVEVCWAMVLNIPPLYMEFDVKVGTKVDTNLYTKRSSGDTVMALVWPPLFNGKGGGLLSKGVVEAVKTVKKR